MNTNTPKPRPTLYQTPDNIAQTGLIPAARWSELTAEVERRIKPVFDAQGKEIQNGFITERLDGKQYLHVVLPSDPTNQHARRELLNELMTDEEIQLIADYYHAAYTTRRDEERFAKAQHIPEAQWDGGVFWGDEYYDSLEAFYDKWECRSEEGDVLPMYLWAARPQVVIPSLDVEDVVQHWIDDRGWEDMDVFDLNGVQALQDALKAFVEANSPVVSYQEDTTRAIILDPGSFEQ